MEPKISCPLCLAKIALPLPDRRGLQTAAKTHACEQQGTPYTSVFRRSRHRDGRLDTLTIVTEWK